MPASQSTTLPLSGFTVLEIGGGAAGAYCGRLLVDAGACVITTAVNEDLELAGIVRGEGVTEAAYAAFLAAGKQHAPSDAESLSKSADLALYDAKHAGRNNYRISNRTDL